MKALVSFSAVAAFALLLHCGEDKPTPIECTIPPQGKVCECTYGAEAIGFCSEQVLGISNGYQERYR